MPGTLYLVATPIGNLQDITLRALDVLRTVDLIACEDTRHTRKLLTHFRISNELVSYHEHNEHERAEELAERLLFGDSIALVSDAGTPGIADPGYRLVGRAIETGAQVVSIPGPAAFVSAVVASGLATDSILFAGFLPPKKGERRKRLEEVCGMPATLVFYEAPHRLTKSLSDCAEILGDRRAAVARELTKLHEEIRRGTLTELAAMYSGAGIKGEVVVVIDRGGDSGRPVQKNEISQLIASLEASGETRKSALKRAAKELGVSRSEAYRLFEAEKKTAK
jgi:16S rRNA (cytidine1402-2'-O)-methyltransferase